MRSILNISLPPSKKAEIQNRAKKAGKTVSAYIMYVIELEESLISEEELLSMAENAKNDFKAGKTKELRSLADLMG